MKRSYSYWVVGVTAALFILSLSRLSWGVLLEQVITFSLGNSLTIYQPARVLSIPTRPAGQTADEWTAWIYSVANPVNPDQVPLQTGVILLQVGCVTTASDDRWFKVGFNYKTGSSQWEFYPVNCQVYAPNQQGVFHYWRPVWLPLLPGQNLSIYKWVTETNNTQPAALFIGSGSGQGV